MALLFHSLQDLPAALVPKEIHILTTVSFCSQVNYNQRPRNIIIGSIRHVTSLIVQFVKTQIERLSWFIILRKIYITALKPIIFGLTPLFGDRRGFMPPQLKTKPIITECNYYI